MEVIRFANDVLIGVGERPQASLNTTVGRKVALSIRDALEDFQLANNWAFTKLRAQALSKLGAVLTIPPMRQIQSLTFRDTPLYPTNLEELDLGATYSYAILSDSEVEVSVDLENYAIEDFTAVGYSVLVVDLQDETSAIPVPDRFLPVLRTQAIYRMAVDHLGDGQLAQAKAQEFTRMVSAYQARETGVGRTNQNMYKRRR